MFTVLDIGAGSPFFLKNLRRKNKIKNFLGFVGEPNWGVMNLLDKYVPDNLSPQVLIDNNARGIYKIISTYEDMNFDDESLDMITINSPHPMTPPGSDFPLEIQRCLKSKGIFFYGHSTYIDINLPENFKLLCEGVYPRYSPWGIKIDLVQRCGDYPVDYPNIILPSQTIKFNIKEKFIRDTGGPKYLDGDIRYMYNQIPLVPNYKVWQKLD